MEAMPAAFGVEVARCLFAAKPADLGDETALALLRAGCRTRDHVLAHEGGGAAAEELAAFQALILEGQRRSAAEGARRRWQGMGGVMRG